MTAPVFQTATPATRPDITGTGICPECWGTTDLYKQRIGHHRPHIRTSDGEHEARTGPHCSGTGDRPLPDGWTA